MLLSLCSCGLSIVPPDGGTEGGGAPSACSTRLRVKLAGAHIAPLAACQNAVVDDLPLAGGLLSESRAGGCPSSRPTVGAACTEPLCCSYGSAQPGCYNVELSCVGGRWAELLHTDPNVPNTASSPSCQVEALPTGCPSPESAFLIAFLRNDACSLPDGTTCRYGHGGAPRCVEFTLRCRGTTWQRTPENPWDYCQCTQMP
jgi:hypothetical protein